MLDGTFAMIFKVKDKNEYFQALASLPVAMVVADVATATIIYVNPAAEKLYLA